MELLIDLQQQEDQLDVANILMAREQAKLEIASSSPHRVKRVPHTRASWWRGTETDEAKNETEIYIPAEFETKSVWSKLSAEEKLILCNAIGYTEEGYAPGKPAQYIEHKINLTVANCTISLANYDKDILVLSWCNLLCSLENRPSAGAFRVSARTESFLVEGASIEHDLVPVITADNTVGTKGSENVLQL